MPPPIPFFSTHTYIHIYTFIHCLRASHAFRFLPEEHTEYWGSLVPGGWGSNNIRQSARECHDSCVDKAERAEFKNSCNAWVYHPETKECWLKNQRDPSVPAVRASGPLIPWTSGGEGRGGRLMDCQSVCLSVSLLLRARR